MTRPAALPGDIAIIGRIHPEPLISAEVDLQDFAFMPLQVARLRDSELAAEENPEACWYAVLLWAASWHQIPAGSLPDNDTALMRLVGLGRDARTWKKHRAGALRGFVLCSDGRLYHPVVVEKAKEAWHGKLQQRHRIFCAAIRKHNERYPENRLQSPSFDEWEALGRPERVAPIVTQLSRVTDAHVTREKHSKRKGQGQGQGQGQGDSNIDTPDGVLSDGEPPDPGPVQELHLDLQDATPAADPPLTPQDIVETWNDFAPQHGLPLVVGKLSETRRRNCAVRIREHPDRATWAKAFRAIAERPWMHGSNERGWRADFDFLIQAKSFTKLIEDSYGKN